MAKDLLSALTIAAAKWYVSDRQQREILETLERLTAVWLDLDDSAKEIDNVG